MGLCIRRCGVRATMSAGLLTAAACYAATVPLTLAADAASAHAGRAAAVLLISLGGQAAGTAGTASFAATNNASPRSKPAATGAHTPQR